MTCPYGIFGNHRYLDGEKEHETQAHEMRSSTTGVPCCKSAAP